LELALQAHEKENPLTVVRKIDGTEVSEGYKPQPLTAAADNGDENGAGAA
jgi:hypothetical protein